MYYEVDFTFYVASGNKETKNNLLHKLDNIKTVDVYHVYDDGEDWCINCIAEVETDNINKVDAAMDELLADIEYMWDYHYIKGIIDNDDYWTP